MADSLYSCHSGVPRNLGTCDFSWILLGDTIVELDSMIGNGVLGLCLLGVGDRALIGGVASSMYSWTLRGVGGRGRFLSLSLA